MMKEEAFSPMICESSLHGFGADGRRDDGAGLGLSICQEIVTAHGWQLCARNTAQFRLLFRTSSEWTP